MEGTPLPAGPPPSAPVLWAGRSSLGFPALTLVRALPPGTLIHGLFYKV